MAICWLFQDIGDPDRLEGTRPVIDHHSPPLACSKVGRNDATENVGRRARTGRDDDSDDVRRIVLGLRRFGRNEDRE
jgi:hypothetical protein